MYVLDATNNLPRILLRGQDGGPGGRGQDGGDGSDGAQGVHAESHFFSGCCRAAGWGGNGGPGGAAGRGGSGGRGGQGGRITLLTSEASIAVLADVPPAIDMNPGQGGSGGLAGNPGAGGRGGSAGSADCELWCASAPERHGTDGLAGAPGLLGRLGEPGPPPLPDAFQVYPITPEQWDAAFNQPHILQVNPYDVEPEETVQIVGQNFIPGTDKVYFDGVLQSDMTAKVSSSTDASFMVPRDAEGGPHPVIIRPVGLTSRRSNRVWVRVIPRLDGVPPTGTRLTETQTAQLTGLAFGPGCQVIAEDWSIAGHPGATVPVTASTRTSVDIQIPPAPLGPMRGVRRLRVRNPDGGTSRAERVVRISDTIVVNVAAWRVVGTSPGKGTTRSAADITNLFTEGALNSAGVSWQQGRVAFRLVQPVGTITVTDDNATVWPLMVLGTDQAALNQGPGLPGVLHLFFVRDVQIATAYAYFGGGPIFCGDNAGILSIEKLAAIVAHEAGHALCLRHICDAGEGPGTFFNRTCQDGDRGFLMYPFWNTQNGVGIPAGQVDAARIGATHLEEGKTTPFPIASMFMGGNINALPVTLPQCQTADAE